MAAKLYAGKTLLGYLTDKPPMDWPRSYYDFIPTEEFVDYQDILDGPDDGDYSKKREIAKNFNLKVIDIKGETFKLHYIIIENNIAMIREGFINRKNKK